MRVIVKGLTTMQPGLAWRDFIDSLDTPGGHIICLMFLLFPAGAMVYFKLDHASVFLSEIVGALLIVLRGTQKNVELRNGIDTGTRHAQAKVVEAQAEVIEAKAAAEVKKTEE